MKPCGHDGQVEDCRVCWLHANDERYRSLYNGTKSIANRGDKCVHLWKRARDEEGKVKKRWCKTG